VTVSATTDARRVVVRWRDSGPGVVAPESLFQPFQPGSEGSGLGLYISRTLVRSFGGELRYEPQPAGSCFVVELPCRTSARRRPASERSAMAEVSPAITA
jgi:signal transduction histidine kinase